MLTVPSPVEAAHEAPDQGLRVARVVQRLARNRHVGEHRVLPATAGATAPFPRWIAPELAAALQQLGIEGLYAHQAHAVEAIRTHQRDLVVATPTASGKTLCYNLPVFDALLREERARALHLFPTKALARDQVEGARRLAAACGESLGVAVYDGDTPADQRRAARRRARIIATNPDMLHAGILPHHTSWSELFSGLRYVVVDELHSYRGVFGSHVANVLRRLRRIAAFHGAAQLRFVATSATIANPEELAAQLFGRPAMVVRESTAPAGERHFMIYNPPVLDPALGVRESYLKAACKLTRQLAAGGLSTLVFCRSRLAVEVLVRYLRDTLDVEPRGVDSPAPPAELERRVRGYRGGYLPDRRRGVERAMRAGNPDVVVATSALELGVDIGSLDAVVLAGWPGSRAATWQRAGRAGRRLTPSLTVLVASSEPVDQFVAGNPDYLFGQAPEHARVAPDNASILIPHLKCAAFELPFARQEPFGSLQPADTDEALTLLAEARLLHQSDRGFHYVGDQYPASAISLRGHLDENFVVVDEPAGAVIAEVDYRDVPEVLHDSAIYQLEGKQYQVLRLDHDNHKAYVSRVEVDYYTQAHTHRRLRILDARRHTPAATAAMGEVHVLARVVGFKKIKLHSHENIGYGEVDQPAREMHTTAFWTTFPERLLRALPDSSAELAAAVLGLSHALHSAAALALMSERADIGLAVGDARASSFAAADRPGRVPFSTPEDGAEIVAGGPPTIFLYDRYPGGTGLAERLFDLRADLLGLTAAMLARCRCEAGCPACIGAGATAPIKARARALAEALAADLAAERDVLLGSGDGDGLDPR